MINEAIQRRDFATLVFGITDGWWRFRDEGRRLPHSPLLDLEGWRVALAEAGFTEVVAMPGPGDAPAQAVLTAIAAEEAALRQAHPAPVRAAARPASPAPATAPGAAPAAARMAVRRALAEALRVPLDEIEDARSFVELGVDSIVGVDLAERLSRRLGVAVPVVALFDHPSVAALAAHIATEHESLLRAPEAIATVGAEARRAETQAVAGTTVPPGRDAASQSRAEVPIAVVGMAGRFPGARDLAGFWRNLRDGVASISDPPPGRWPRARGAPDFPAGGAWRRGGFLDTVDRFDPLPFEMSGTEADYTDPQARLFFTTAWHAFEDAGYGPAWLDGRSCGVFVGVAAGDYPAGALPGEPPPPHAFLGNAQSVLAGRLAYLLNLRGPALAVDTACSSSLVALHLACRSIAARECEIALAGGVFATSTPAFHYLTGALGMTSPTGATYAFDDRADGFVPGEGVGALVLRRLDEAVAGGDHIWGVIRATGTNQDGRTLGPTAPSARAQADLVADVLARAGLPASALDYVEAHGTGTRLGDPVEVEALARVLRNDGATAPGACVLGSVKTNIGHAGPAAGVAGVIKVLLALAHDEIPPSLNFSVPNRHIDLTGDSPLAVCDRSHPWPRRPERPRVAGVSAFGLSGTNAHALIEEAPRTALRGPEPEGPFVFPLSGRTPEALARRAAELAAWLDGPGLDARLADVAYTLAVGRRHMACRLGVVAADREALRAALKGAAHASPAGTAPPRTSSEAPMATVTAGARSVAVAVLGDSASIQALGEAYEAGAEVDWLALYDGTGLHRVSLPTYPFAEARHWVRLAEGADEAPAPNPVRIFAPAWAPEHARPERPLPASVLVLDRQGDLAAALAGRVPLAHRPVAGSLPTPFGSHPAVVVRPDAVADDAVTVAEGLLTMARAALAGAAAAEAGAPQRLLVIAQDGDEIAAEALTAFAALGAALGTAGSPLAWTALRVPAEATAADIAEAVLAELRVEPAAAEVRVDPRGARTVRRVRSVPPITPSATLAAGSVCWIAGGAGALGRMLAGHLIWRHGARVVLSSRHPAAGLPAGAEALPCDVTEPAAVERAAAEIRARHGRIDAVFHLAGKMRAAPLATAEPAALRAVLATKMAGAINLDRATASDRLAVFVLYSSLAAELGDFGQGDYAMANRFFAGFAAFRAAEARAGRRYGRSLSLAWPLWQEGALAPAGAGRDAVEAATGLGALESEAGLAALDRLLGAPDGHWIVLPEGTRDPFIEQPAASAAPPLQGPASVPSALRERLRALLAAQLGLPATDIADDAPFGTLGLDSLHIRGFADSVSKALEVDVPPTDLFRANTVAALARHLAPAVSAEPLRTPPAPVTVRATPAASLAVAVRTERRAEPIAIIGMAGRFPGAPDLDAFWEALHTGRDLVTEVPPDRWDWRAQGRAGILSGETEVPRWGGFITDVDRFDAAFFGVSPREAAFLDPQARLLLETAWHALEDAAVPPSTLAGTAVGVFVGSQLNDYAEIIGDAAGEAAPQAVLGNTRTMLANRLSFLLDLRGPSEAVDTACSASLVARASRGPCAARRGMRARPRGRRAPDADAARAGAGHGLGMLSPTGRCRTFDAGADGYVRGEGVGVVVLKPLAEARGGRRSCARRDPGQRREPWRPRAAVSTAPNPDAQSALVAGVLGRVDVPDRHDRLRRGARHGHGARRSDRGGRAAARLH